MSKYLSHLVLAGFITEHYQWSLGSRKFAKQALYRLSDCYIRFHLKYISPHLQLLQQRSNKKTIKGVLPGWDTIVGFQLENLLLSNREFIFEVIGIDPDTVVCDNPFVQKKTSRQKGCQIDYLIQTKMNTLVVCEFKFKRSELDPSIIQEMEKKCNSLSVPRGFGKAPVLFHIGGVHPKVEESFFFYRIIDLRDWFEN